MKNKKYKVTIKYEYITSMDHTQTSKDKAINDVKKVVEHYLTNGKDVRNLFDQPPKTIYKAEIKYEDEK